MFMDGSYTRVVNKILEGKPGEGRRKWKTRLMWMDNVELDQKNIDVKDGVKELWTKKNGHVMREVKAKL
jgi:hypothetical protein